METPTTSKVVVISCKEYDPAHVEQAVARGIELLGGIGRFARAGERILLKPNLLAPKAPDKAVTTHPTVFHAVAKQFQATGAHVAYGDSPGLHKPEPTARKSGIATAAAELGIELADFLNGETVHFPAGEFIKQFTLAKGLLQADAIVSLPKLKAHALTRMTGAVKNQFGCVPGFLKAEFHARLGDVERFTQMLVDLNRCIRPRLFIMDAIVAMEGNGPSSGDPRKVGAILLSQDPVALDAIACRLVNLDPALVPTNRVGQQAGLGTFEDIELAGDPVTPLIVTDFNVKRDPEPPRALLGGLLGRLLKQRITPRPTIDPAACTKCGTCVHACPVDPKAVDFRNGKKQPPEYNYHACIRCYCCQEMCPENAIQVQTPLLGRILH